ncbi:hypothetical protein U128_04780 [Anaplasma marginale str. Gypsy Plains]|nr:hypothetical protein [Anaplasma marginale]AGZ79342.1 hypothetical protein U128_04780 [Anaplasma marginale str. Gypsy Plains]
MSGIACGLVSGCLPLAEQNGGGLRALGVRRVSPWLSASHMTVVSAAVMAAKL